MSCRRSFANISTLRLTDVDVVSRIDITRSMTKDTSSNKIFLVSFQKSSNVLEAFLASLRILVLLFKSYSNQPHCSDVIEYDLTPICGSGLDVESRNDVSRSMARDSSSNNIFLVSFQKSCYVLEAFLPSSWLPIGMVVWDGDSNTCQLAVLYYTILYYTILLANMIVFFIYYFSRSYYSSYTI